MGEDGWRMTEDRGRRTVDIGQKTDAGSENGDGVRGGFRCRDGCSKLSDAFPTKKIYHIISSV